MAQLRCAVDTASCAPVRDARARVDAAVDQRWPSLGAEALPFQPLDLLQLRTERARVTAELPSFAPPVLLLAAGTAAVTLFIAAPVLLVGIVWLGLAAVRGELDGRRLHVDVHLKALEVLPAAATSSAAVAASWRLLTF